MHTLNNLNKIPSQTTGRNTNNEKQKHVYKSKVSLVKISDVLKR